MITLSRIGRIFCGASIAATGLLTIYYKDLPYFFIPPDHAWLSGRISLIYICGGLLFLAGACIVFEIRTRLLALLLGGVLLAIFLFYFLPYQFSASSRYAHFGTWENAFKELALAAGALVIAGRISFGGALFALTIISFGIDHFVFAIGASGYVPSWIPAHLFWIYAGGVGLLGSGLAILLKIRRALFATLLGSMILIWFLILHIPYALSAPFADNAGEVTSAFLALAYCGIAFAIAGVSGQQTITST